jgi:hypothetical protein
MQRLLQGAVLVTLAFGASRASGADPSIPVRITNTPVPVTVTNPTTSVNGAVAVTNTVPVRVVGRETPQPFQRQFVLDWPDSEGFVTTSYQVPAGMRLVIEYASLFAFLQPEGQAMFIRILTTVNGNEAFHNLAVQKQEDYGVLKQFGAAHAVRIYADAGSMVQVSAGRVPFTNTANCSLTLSGHFESVP